VSLDPEYDYRTGIGTDIHRLVVGRELRLGGITVPFDRGLLGHSDGDAVLHAIVDCLLGAAGLGDIGTFFPDHDPEYKDADSRQLLLTVVEYLGDRKWEIVNLDIIINAEMPKLGPYKMQMKRAIASIIGVDFNAVNVKAKTAEGLGDIGAVKAISSMAMVLLRKRIRRSL